MDGKKVNSAPASAYTINSSSYVPGPFSGMGMIVGASDCACGIQCTIVSERPWHDDLRQFVPAASIRSS